MTVNVGSVLMLFRSIERAKKMMEIVTSDKNEGDGVFLSQEEIQQCVDPRVLLTDPGIIALRVYGNPDFLDSLMNGG